MLVYIAVLLLCVGYLIRYAAHCFGRGRTLPAVGALMLAVLPGLCAAIFVFIFTDLSGK